MTEKEKNRQSKKILVVEDNEHLRELYKRVLEKAGYLVFMAANGADGITVANRERPQLIITDLRLPQMRGEEMVQKIKQFLPAVAVIVATAELGEDVESFARQAGMSFLRKPFTSQPLLAEVRKLLAQKS